MAPNKKERKRRIALAIFCVRSGKKLTVAAINYCIPKSTLF